MQGFGPMKARVIPSAEEPSAPAQQPAAPDALHECGPPFHCRFPVPRNAVLELSVGKLEKTTHEWGMLCLCQGDDCVPDCAEEESRIDVRVSCPATRFALYQQYGLVSAPLPAHLPLDVTCRPSLMDSAKLDCSPLLVSLDKGSLTVSGALRLAKEPSDVQANEMLVFKAMSGAKGKNQDAHLCLHDTCSNPAYFLPLRVHIEGSHSQAPLTGLVPLVPSAVSTRLQRFSSACLH